VPSATREYHYAGLFEQFTGNAADSCSWNPNIANGPEFEVGPFARVGE
jgi:hypothetical protein